MPRWRLSERRTRASTPCRLVLFAVLAWANAAWAADQHEPSLAQCADIAEDAERLACFDRAVRPPAPVAEEPTEDASHAVEPERAAPAVESEPSLISREVGQDRAEAREAPPAEAEKRGFLRRLFRDRDRNEPSAEAPASPPDDAAEGPGTTAKVVRVVKLMRGNFQVVLDNGETWRENEYQPGTSYEVGDAVRIRERFMGMHDLTNQRTRQVVRVNRVR